MSNYNINDAISDINKKLDVLDMRVDSIDKTMVKQELNLSIHMKRSDTLEQMMLQMRKEMKPIERHVVMIEGAMKFLGIISLSLSIIGAILKIFGVI